MTTILKENLDGDAKEISQTVTPRYTKYFRGKLYEEVVEMQTTYGGGVRIIKYWRLV